MSMGVHDCWDALQRLKSGKPNNPGFKGKTITANLVSKEAGFGPGYVKPSRHPELCEAIRTARETQNGKMVYRKRLDQEKIAKRQASDNAEFYKRAWQDALAREIRLIRRIRQLEVELESIKG